MHIVADDSEMETLQRALGCVLLSLMPESGVDDAIRALWDSYRFAIEDQELTAYRPTRTLHAGISIGSEAADL